MNEIFSIYLLSKLVRTKEFSKNGLNVVKVIFSKVVWIFPKNACVYVFILNPFYYPQEGKEQGLSALNTNWPSLFYRLSVLPTI